MSAIGGRLLYARRIACYSTSLFFLCLFSQRVLHGSGQRERQEHSAQSVVGVEVGIIKFITALRKVQGIVTLVVALVTAFLPDLIVFCAKDQRAYKASRTIACLAALSTVLVVIHVFDISIEAKHIRSYKFRSLELSQRRKAKTPSPSNTAHFHAIERPPAIDPS